MSINTITSNFARSQTNEEIVKAKIIVSMPQKKALIHEVEDNELLRGRIAFPLLCAGYHDEISSIDFDYLEKVSTVFKTYFNKELDSNDEEFDLFRRALLAIASATAAVIALVAGIIKSRKAKQEEAREKQRQEEEQEIEDYDE